MDKNKQVTVGAKEGLGLGIVSMAVILLFLPSMSQKIADLDFIQSEAFGILSGAAMVLGIFVLIAGLAVTFAKFDDDIDEG